MVEAADYFKSSDVQLDGVDAPATHQFTWKELPSGAYRVEAILTRDDGERKTVTECFAVLGPDDSADSLRPAPKRSAPPDPGHRPLRLLMRTTPAMPVRPPTRPVGQISARWSDAPPLGWARRRPADDGCVTSDWWRHVDA